jgi:hypothetical protein
MLRWRRAIAEDVLVLGDAWERSYGDLQWRGMQPERTLPWVALWQSRRVTDHERRRGGGARRRLRRLDESTPRAFRCGWIFDAAEWRLRPANASSTRPSSGVCREPVHRSRSSRILYSVLCTDPLLTGPLVGANNWYYGYGRDFGETAVLRDAQNAVRPDRGSSRAPVRCCRRRMERGRYSGRSARLGRGPGTPLDTSQFPGGHAGSGPGRRGARCASRDLVPPAAIQVRPNVGELTPAAFGHLRCPRARRVVVDNPADRCRRHRAVRSTGDTI